jgi:hypothetical protein
MDDSRESLPPETTDDTADLQNEAEVDEDDDELNTKDPLPDWVYEEAAGRLFRMAPESHLKLLGVPVTGPIEFLPMPGPENPKPTSIQLYRLSDGRAAQVHCVQKVPKDLVPTMGLHRAALLQTHPIDNLEQYVVVLGDGTVRRHDDPVHTGRYFELNLLYVKDVEPEWFALSSGFALLCRSRAAPWVSQLLQPAGATLEPFVVPPDAGADVLHEMDENQPGIPAQLVSLFFDGRFGPPPDVPLAARGSGWAAALTTALALHAITEFGSVRRLIGRREGIADVLGDVLRERFGRHPDIPALAYQLAGLPDLDAVLQIITAADELDDLSSTYLTR